MSERFCPYCDAILAEATQDCSYCGELLPLPEEVGQRPSLGVHLPNAARHMYVTSPASFLPRLITPRVTRFFTLSGRRSKGDTPAALLSSPRPQLFTSPLTDEPLESQRELDEGKIELSPEREATWHKIVDTPAYQVPATYPPRPPLPEQSPPMLYSQSFLKRHISPVAFFWISCGVLFLLIGGSIFGIASTLGRGALHLSTNEKLLSLQVTPHVIAIGAIVTLRGDHFTPGGHIGITRDHSIPVIDTGGIAITTANKQGAFTDTVTIEPGWGNGPHSIDAEDAATHQLISFPILVTGNGAELRPSHLLSSINNLDLGSGDQATNTTKTVGLTNSGDEQIAWHAETSQPWLVMSPEHGSIASGSSVQVAIAVARMGMDPGIYTGQVVFTTNVGNMVLPVHVDVTQLEPGHDAVIQLTPAILAFNAVDGQNAPASQNIVVANPGLIPLHWQVSSDVSWLSFSQQSGSVNPSGSDSVTVEVNTRSMLPGTYNGVITFQGQGVNVLHHTQSIYVSVTIAQGCSLRVSPSILTFSAVYHQSDPGIQFINLAGSANCSTPIQWSAKSSSNWLNVSSTHGATPQRASVSIAAAGLQPGVYSGSVTFTSSLGIDILVVNFTLGQPGAPLMSSIPGGLTFNGIAGQGGSTPTQTFVFTNIGGGDLAWQANVTTGSGGNWLSVSPGSGSLPAHQKVTLSVNTQLLGALNLGTYSGTIKITGTDTSGRAAPGSPQTLSVNFVVNPPCTLAVAPGDALTFDGIAGQLNPATQAVMINAAGSCTSALAWTASNTTIPAGGKWLSVTPSSGLASLSNAGITRVGVTLAGLPVGVYQGTLTISAIDSVTQAAVGPSQTLTITFNVHTPCTLQSASTDIENFSSEVGTNPAMQTFSIGVNGTCAGNVTITPNVTLASGAGWLTVTPGSVTVAVGSSATFSVQVTSTSLPAGAFTGAIALSATNSGVPLVGSPQTVNVTLNMLGPAVLLATPASLTFNVTTGTSTQAITLSNTGGVALNWTAGLASDAPFFVSLSAASGSNLTGGASLPLNVTVDATLVASGTVNTSIILSAIDVATGNEASGSPLVIPVTINVAPAVMQLNSSALTFSTTVGSDPAPQTIVLTNSGGGTLTWTVEASAQSWLTVSPMSGSTVSGSSVVLTFSVSSAGLDVNTAGYNAQISVIPSTGPAISVAVTLLVNDVVATPIVTLTATPTTPPETATPTTGPEIATPTTPPETATPTTGPEIATPTTPPETATPTTGSEIAIPTTSLTVTPTTNAGTAPPPHL